MTLWEFREIIEKNITIQEVLIVILMIITSTVIFFLIEKCNYERKHKLNKKEESEQAQIRG